jgi:ComF family protein
MRGMRASIGRGLALAGDAWVRPLDGARDGGAKGTMTAESPGRPRNLSNFFAKKLDSLAGALLPAQCVLCGGRAGRDAICPACRHELPRLGDACPRCALPSPGGATCTDCIARPPPLDFAVAAFRYEFPVDRMIQALKYAGQLAHAQALGSALAGAWARAPALDALVPLPLAAARQRERGFNQAVEIARPVAAARDIVLDDGLARLRDTPPQASLALRERARNLRGAFVARHAFAGLRVAIVDDVMTTGASLHAAARALRAAGAREVGALVVARTLR